MRILALSNLFLGCMATAVRASPAAHIDPSPTRIISLTALCWCGHNQTSNVAKLCWRDDWRPVGAIFDALSACQALHPDPHNDMDSGSEDDGVYDDADEVNSLLSLINSSSGNTQRPSRAQHAHRASDVLRWPCLRPNTSMTTAEMGRSNSSHMEWTLT